MYVKLNGEMVYPWRALDHEGETLESYITPRRDKGFVADDIALDPCGNPLGRLPEVPPADPQGAMIFVAMVGNLLRRNAHP